MAINLDDRYPGRAGGKTLDYPQGSFKNRTSPNAQDGTFLEQDWANDMLAFFQALMSDAGMVANNVVDTARASQYFDALVKTIKGNAIPGATFAELDAATADQGPAICLDMGGYLYVWTTSAYFEGYRSVLCGEIPPHFAPTPRAWEMSATGGVWSDADPKQKRLIALFRERGQVVTAGAWAKGWGRIADLGGGDWKAPDLQDVFLRMAGTDADTANPAPTGAYKGDTIKSHSHIVYGRNFSASGSATRELQSAPLGADVNTAPTGTAETAPEHTRVLPVVLV